jgi:hypothetical protein
MEAAAAGTVREIVSLRANSAKALLMHLRTPAEDAIDARTAHLRFNIPFLAVRLVSATDWLRKEPRTLHLPIGILAPARAQPPH